jgi:hypothetical protein
MIEGISAVTLGTHEMPRAVRFTARQGLRSRMAAESLHSPASPDSTASRIVFYARDRPILARAGAVTSSSAMRRSISLITCFENGPRCMYSAINITM